jgi:nitroreductase
MGSISDHPQVLPFILSRRSSVAFNGQPLLPAELNLLLEAARWAPSSFNEQPWKFLWTLKSDEKAFSTVLKLLSEANREWARHAGALILGISSRVLNRNGNPNRFALHDLGLATQNLVLQAESMGLNSHLMGGYDMEAARSLFKIGEDFETGSFIAIGYPGDNESLPAHLHKRQTQSRSRKDISEISREGLRT